MSTSNMEYVWGMTFLFLLLYLQIQGGLAPLSDIAPRLCGSDYTTAGRCFVVIEENLNWQAADGYCRGQLPKPGYLAAIEDKASQDLVATGLRNRGLEKVWINGFLGHRQWHWQGHNKFFAFQGCYIDITDDSDLQKRIFLTPDKKPLNCLSMCDEDFAGIQLDSSGHILCFCGWEFGKHGVSYSPQCDNRCPTAQMGDDPVNMKCGKLGHQLIYHVNGTRFNGFPGADQTLLLGHCAMFDRNRFGHPWWKRNCHDKLSFICEYIYLNQQDCIEFNTVNRWVAGRCISIETDIRDFYQAQEYCNQYNALLLKVDSKDIHDAVVELLASDTSYFMALTNEEWLFSLEYYDTIYKYFNWGAGQPVDTEGQRCLILQDDGWSNTDCSLALSFVCMVVITDGPTTLPPDAPSSSTSMSAPLPSDAPASSSPSPAPGDDNIGSLPKDLVIGLAAGGGALILLVGLVICFVVRRKKQNRLHRRNMRTNNRHHPSIPTPPTGQSANSAVYNPAYHPHQPPRGRSGQSETSYEEIGNSVYQGLGSRSTASHHYERTRRKEYDDKSGRSNGSKGYDKRSGRSSKSRGYDDRSGGGSRSRGYDDRSGGSSSGRYDNNTLGSYDYIDPVESNRSKY